MDRLVNILIGREDPFTDRPADLTGDFDEHYCALTDVPERDALAVALGTARSNGYCSGFDIVIRRTSDLTKFNAGYYHPHDAIPGGSAPGYHWTHQDFDLDTKED